MRAKGPSRNHLYTLLLAIWLAGAKRATRIPAAVCKERATKPASQRAAALAGRRGAGPSASLLGRSSIATDTLPPSCLASGPAALATKRRLFLDGPLVCLRTMNQKRPTLNAQRSGPFAGHSHDPHCGIPLCMKTDRAAAWPLSAPLSTRMPPDDKGGDEGSDKDA